MSHFCWAMVGLLLIAPGWAQPNVVLIFADDLGYGDLSCYGATKVRTPHIDRMARDGRRFTDAHSASAVCTPSRYALLTGEYPMRGNGGKGIWGPCSHTQPLLINPEKLTLPQVFKNTGYATAAVGKWHLGFGKSKTDWNKPLRPGPMEVGFDYFFGIPKVNSGYPYVYVENDRIVGWEADDPLVFGKPPYSKTTTYPPEAGKKTPNKVSGAKKAHAMYDDEKIGTLVVEKSVKWIRENKDKPFFLYVPTTNIHHPFTPAPRFKGTSDCGLYGDFIHELDWMVGEILKCLEANSLTDNTLVIFTSDNGGMLNLTARDAWQQGHRINGDLLGFKFGVWEGGHRVPFIAKWPGKIPASTVSDQLLCNVDMLATAMALTGQDVSSLTNTDSVNLLQALIGNPEAPIRKDLVLAPNKRQNLAIRKGKWMYIGARGSGGFSGSNPSGHAMGGAPAAAFAGSINSDIENGKYKRDAPSAQLYDLEADLQQTQNLHDSHPEVVKAMRALLANYATAKAPASKPKTRAAAKSAPKTRVQSGSFDFELGELAPWTVVEGEFGHPIGSREGPFSKGKGAYNKQGEYYLTTLEASSQAERGSDTQAGVIESPLFICKGGTMTFRVGGGSGPETYVALCAEDGRELQSARGARSHKMQPASWDLSAYVGKALFIRVVDRSTGGWGHVTADDFRFEGEQSQ